MRLPKDLDTPIVDRPPKGEPRRKFITVLIGEELYETLSDYIWQYGGTQDSVVQNLLARHFAKHPPTRKRPRRHRTKKQD